MEYKDFFNEYFDLSKFPTDLKKEEWKPNRDKLSRFFYKFINFYRRETLKRNFHYLFFSLIDHLTCYLRLNEYFTLKASPCCPFDHH